MPYYVKVTPKVKEQILPSYVKKPKAKDGNYLLFQNDLIGIEGNTLSERCSRVGGALLTPAERKAEGDGTVENPAYCYTPKEYGGEDTVASERQSDSFENAEINQSVPSHVEVVGESAKEESEVKND